MPFCQPACDTMVGRLQVPTQTEDAACIYQPTTLAARCVCSRGKDRFARTPRNYNLHFSLMSVPPTHHKATTSRPFTPKTQQDSVLSAAATTLKASAVGQCPGQARGTSTVRHRACSLMMNQIIRTTTTSNSLPWQGSLPRLSTGQNHVVPPLRTSSSLVQRTLPG